MLPSMEVSVFWGCKVPRTSQAQTGHPALPVSHTRHTDITMDRQISTWPSEPAGILPAPAYNLPQCTKQVIPLLPYMVGDPNTTPSPLVQAPGLTSPPAQSMETPQVSQDGEGSLAEVLPRQTPRHCGTHSRLACSPLDSQELGQLGRRDDGWLSGSSLAWDGQRLLP